MVLQDSNDSQNFKAPDLRKKIDSWVDQSQNWVDI